MRRRQCLRRNRPAQNARNGLRLKITIESFNYQIRKIIKNRGHFPTDDAAVKLIWLAILDVEDKRADARAKAAEKAAAEGTRRNGQGRNARLVEGAATYGWRHALNAFAIMFEGRIPENAI